MGNQVASMTLSSKGSLPGEEGTDHAVAEPIRATSAAVRRFPKAGGASHRVLSPLVLVAIATVEVARAISSSLLQARFTPMVASTEEEAIEILGDIVPELVVVDVRLRALTDWVVSQAKDGARKPRAAVLLCEDGVAVPASFVDGQTRLAMRKPVSMEDLLDAIARVDEISAKKSDAHLLLANGSTLQEFGPLSIDLSKQMVFRRGQMRDEQGVELSPAEFRLLRFFSSNQDRCFTRAEILRGVWGGTAVMEERTVDVHVVRLRRALEPLGASSLIRTVRGVGYAAGVNPAS